MSSSNRDRIVMAVALASSIWLLTSPAAADSHIDFGGQDNDEIITSSDSEFSSLGDLTAEIGAAAEEDVVGGSGGTFAFPINVTVYGRPHVRIPDSPTAWDEYCFVVSYSTSPIDEADDRQAAAYGGFELQQDRDYLEPATSQYERDHAAWEDAVAWVDAENDRREEAGEPLLGYPPEPQPPGFPLDVCEGEPGQVPDFTPAFEAAADLIRSVDPAAPWIAPGRGITGLEAYLETGRELTVTEATTTLPDLGDDLSVDPFDPAPIPGTVSFRGQGTFTVDWGDGTVAGPFETPGVPYGDTSGPAITHTYADTGDLTVTVTDSWRVSMEVTFLGETFIFTHEEQLEPTTLPFTVGEVRSVRDR